MDNISKTFGPGLWHSIHITALLIDQEIFLKWIKIQVASIPCPTCKEHASQYLLENPPEKYENVYDTNHNLIGMFKWSWKFHNDVNLRLKKPLLDYTTAYSIYNSEANECPEVCGN